MKTSTIRLALVGDAGPYPRVASRLRGARFTAVVSDDPAAARAFADAVWADSLDALLGQRSAVFDAVVIRSADEFLAPLCMRAAAAGKHILADGALAASVNGVREVLAACAGVRLMVARPFRFRPSLQVVKESLDAGRLGEPGLLRVHHWHPPRPGSVVYQLTSETDLACWFFGQHPTEVCAAGHPPHPQEPDYVQLHLGFPNGGMALIDRTQALPPGDSYFSLSLIGSTGAAYADNHHNTQLLFGGGHPTGLATGEGDGPLLAELREFVSAIEQGREPSVSGSDALRATQVAMAATVSRVTGHAFRWDGERYVKAEARGGA